MCRAMFSYEASDPDFSWLLATFQEENPDCFRVESGTLPVVLLPQFGSNVTLENDNQINEDIFLNELLGESKKADAAEKVLK